jgi:oligopeptide/dipeptide ABC transporter ATP-binding protein
MTVDAPLLAVEELTVRYRVRRRETTAVHDVSFVVERHETLGLVGESGSGKSSVCGAILDLLSPNATRAAAALTFADHDLLACSADEMRALRGTGISWVPQHASTALAPTTSVGRQLRWYFEERLDDPSVTDALRALGLGVVLDRPRDLPSEFSGGQLQRLVIAIAVLAHQPALVLADEPTSALDPHTATQVLDTLRTANARVGAAMVFVSHDLRTVARACDRIGVMYGGRLVELARAEDLFVRPRHPYTRALLDALPGAAPPRTRLRAIEGSATGANALLGCPFAPRCALARDECHRVMPPLQTTADAMVRCHAWEAA